MHTSPRLSARGRLLAASAAALALTAGLAGCRSSSSASGTSASGNPTVKIMVGGLNKQIYLPFTLAKNLGFYDQKAVDVQLSDEPSGVAAEDAMLSGSVDGVGGFYDHTIDLAGKGKQTESVVQLLQAPGEVVLCRSDLQAQIHSPADWSGRRIGVTGLGSSTNFLAKALAERAGVSPGSITPVAVGAGPTFIAAMQHNAIDCGVTTEPTITAVLQKQLGYVLVDMRTAAGTQQHLGGNYPASSVYMRTDWVNSHKDVVQRLVSALVETQRWIQSHSAAEITDKMPPQYYAGVGKAAYITALQNEKGIYTPDGLMPKGGPDTVLSVLSRFSPSLKGKQIDLQGTYTTEFVTASR